MNTENYIYKILVADDDDEARELTDFTLKSAGYRTVCLDSGLHVLESIYKEAVDLILLDVEMPHLDGFELVRRLRSDFLVRHLPIMILTGTKVEVKDKVEGLGLGSDDYVLKPFEREEFLARIQAVMQRTHRNLDANPLTRLPGNVEILREIENRIHKSKTFVILYADINNFKAFNDRYGFLHGDKAISLLSTTMAEVMRVDGSTEDFLGHVGGDDFVIVTNQDRYERIYKQILDEFTSKVIHLYDEEAQKKGFIVVRSRMGKDEEFPIMSLVIVGVSNAAKNIQHSGHVSALVGELKKFAKNKGGNQFVLDRRN